MRSPDKCTPLRSIASRSESANLVCSPARLPVAPLVESTASKEDIASSHEPAIRELANSAADGVLRMSRTGDFIGFRDGWRRQRDAGSDRPAWG